jgi:hypothetical protein
MVLSRYRRSDGCGASVKTQASAAAVRAFHCAIIAARLNDFVEDVTILIDGTPRPMLSASYGSRHLVQVPDVFWRWFLPAELPCIGRAEFSRHRRIVSWETTMPRSNSISSTSRGLKGSGGSYN